MAQKIDIHNSNGLWLIIEIKYKVIFDGSMNQKIYRPKFKYLFKL